LKNNSFTYCITYLRPLPKRNNAIIVKTLRTQTPKASYQFFISDHQGSVRVVMQKQADSTYVAQQIYYGVTGDIIANTPGGQNLLTHLYQGKEWQDGFGYDFVTRTYDPYTVRFLQVDGANQFASGYTGMGNIPNIGVDPNGQVAIVPIAIAAAALLFTNCFAPLNNRTQIQIFFCNYVYGKEELFKTGEIKDSQRGIREGLEAYS
jgi:hypothetical protein